MVLWFLEWLKVLVFGFWLLVFGWFFGYWLVIGWVVGGFAL
jgi:hypothetical protein